jgi:8-oxo-dGTP pyrophosphatase MutT (NUDIX family)
MRVPRVARSKGTLARVEHAMRPDLRSPLLSRPLGVRHLEAAFALAAFDARAAQRSMEPAFRGDPPFDATTRSPRGASALAYVFEQDGRLRFPLTLRRDDLREHRGQVSLPGGRPEAGETSFVTARREAHEEIGLDPRLPVEVGRLADVYIPVTHTRLRVHVAVGSPPPSLVAAPGEVAELRLADLDDLLAPALRARETWTIRGREVDVPFFTLAGWTVWGATAIALAELAARIERAIA